MTPAIHTHAGHRLYILQTQWEAATLALEAIARDIELHPEWDIEIGPRGLRAKTNPEPSPSNLNHLKLLNESHVNESHG